MEAHINDALHPAPIAGPLHFDALSARDRFFVGTFDMDRLATIDFARNFDPQPFHLDDAAAAASPVFGRLSASGWHTVVMAQMLVSAYMRGAGLVGLAGGGVDKIAWIKPVFPPDTLSVHLEISSSRASKTRPDWGIMTSRTIISDSIGTRVAEIEITGVFLRSGEQPDGSALTL